MNKSSASPRTMVICPCFFQLPNELHDTQLNFLDFSQPHRAKEVPVTDCSA